MGKTRKREIWRVPVTKSIMDIPRRNEMNKNFCIVGLATFFFLSAASPAQQSLDNASAVNWDYSALGDSITFGVGASSTANSFVSRYRDFMQIDNNVVVVLTNHGINGQTSAQLLNAIQTNQTLRIELQNAEVITFDIGGNDLLGARAVYKANACGGADGQNCLRTALANFRSNWDAIVVEILALRANSSVIVKTMDIYNPLINIDENADTFPDDSGLTDLQAIKPYVDQTDLHIRNSCASNNIALTRAYLAFNTVTGISDPVARSLIAADNIHPNDMGHAMLADGFRSSTAPSNATVTVGGRVRTSSGSGVARAMITIVDIYGRSASARTNTFGNYQFTSVILGETYQVSVQGKKLQVSNGSQVVLVNGTMSGIDFIAD